MSPTKENLAEGIQPEEWIDDAFSRMVSSPPSPPQAAEPAVVVGRVVTLSDPDLPTNPVVPLTPALAPALPPPPPPAPAFARAPSPPPPPPVVTSSIEEVSAELMVDELSGEMMANIERLTTPPPPRAP